MDTSNTRHHPSTVCVLSEWKNEIVPVGASTKLTRNYQQQVSMDAFSVAWKSKTVDTMDRDSLYYSFPWKEELRDEPNEHKS